MHDQDRPTQVGETLNLTKIAEAKIGKDILNALKKRSRETTVLGMSKPVRSFIWSTVQAARITIEASRIGLESNRKMHRLYKNAHEQH